MADRTARFNNWFQIISNVAIIFGLGLVVYELNQSKQLASSQFVRDYNARETSIRLAMMGEDPREALWTSPIFADTPTALSCDLVCLRSREQGH